MNVQVTDQLHNKKVGAHYILHSEKDGVFQDVKISNKIKDHIFFQKIFKDIGDTVNTYVGSNTTIGVVLLEFDSIEERDYLMSDISEFIQVMVN